MNDTLQILAGFLDKYSDDVIGHAREELPADLRVRLRDFAHGDLDDTERARLCKSLKENPQWITALAMEARTRRGERDSAR
jgi:hypothetical protein